MRYRGTTYKNLPRRLKRLSTHIRLLSFRDGGEDLCSVVASAKVVPKITARPDSAQPPVAVRCNYCGGAEPSLTCPGCQEARYCSAACQDGDGRFHQHLCARAAGRFALDRRPSALHCRAIVLRPGSEHAEFVWLRTNGRGQLYASQLSGIVGGKLKDLRMFVADRPETERQRFTDRDGLVHSTLPDHLVVAIRHCRNRFQGERNTPLKNLAGPGRLYTQFGVILLVSLSATAVLQNADLLARDVDDGTDGTDGTGRPSAHPPPAAPATKVPCVLQDMSMYDWTVVVLCILGDDMQVSVEDPRITKDGAALVPALKVNCYGHTRMWDLPAIEKVLLPMDRRAESLIHHVSPYAVALGLPWVIRISWPDSRMPEDLAHDPDGDGFVGVLGSHFCMPRDNVPAELAAIGWDAGSAPIDPDSPHPASNELGKLVFSVSVADVEKINTRLDLTTGTFSTTVTCDVPEGLGPGTLAMIQHPPCSGTFYVFHESPGTEIDPHHLTAASRFLQSVFAHKDQQLVRQTRRPPTGKHRRYKTMQQICGQINRPSMERFWRSYVEKELSASPDTQVTLNSPYEPGPPTPRYHVTAAETADIRSLLKNTGFEVD